LEGKFNDTVRQLKISEAMLGQEVKKSSSLAEVMWMGLGFRV